MNRTATALAPTAPATTTSETPSGPQSGPTEPPAPGRPPIWMPWAGCDRPATAAEEHDFGLELADRADTRLGEFTRPDITAVLNALRSGLTVHELCERAPGLQADRLYGAYFHLDRLRWQAEYAWQRIVTERTPESVAQHGDTAATLLPRLVLGIRDALDASSADFARVLATFARSVADTQHAVEEIEREISRCTRSTERAIELGRLLYDPRGDGVTSRPDYLPTRVGTLVPVRVAALLGEAVDGTQLVSPRGAR